MPNPKSKIQNPKSIYSLTLSALTPLHIGTGDTLERDFDYKVHDKKTWVFDPDQLAADLYGADDPRFEQLLQAVPPGQLLTGADFDPRSALFRYILPGRPAAQSRDTAIREQIKTPFDQVYLPGSSLKGALRTLIVRHAYQEEDKQLSGIQLNNSRSWAAQRLERDLLGRDPNHDLLRALQVSDSSGVPAAQALSVLNARVFSRRQAELPIALECIKPDTQFTATLTIDDYLFDHPAAQQKLRFGSKRAWFTDLPRYANEQAKHRFQQELKFYQNFKESRAARTARALSRIINDLTPTQFLLQVGWGGGWHSKTLSFVLTGGEQGSLVKRYRLGRGRYSADTPFPKSRRTIARGKQSTAQPVAPLGWLLVEMQQKP